MNIEKWINGRYKLKAKKSPIVKSIVKSTQLIISEEIELRKAIKDKDWLNISMDHDKDQESKVSSTYHTVNSKIDPEYHSHFYDKSNTYDTAPDIGGGISPKIINNFNGQKFMTKPYYGKSLRDVPLSGFSVMATKNLYHAGGIKDLVEDVSATSLSRGKQKIPVTVHKFAGGFKNAAEFKKNNEIAGRTVTHNSSVGTTNMIDMANTDEDLTEKKPVNVNPHNINQLHAKKIGAMDFLVGNFDRHANNLMVGGIGDNGERNLLAIDHDRSFDYKPHNSPFSQYNISAMSNWMGDDSAYTSNEKDKELASWWTNNKDSIYSEMNNNLREIGDHQLRKYVRRNFDQRHQMLSNWADNHKNTNKSFFQDLEPVNAHPLHTTDEDGLAHLRESLPDNKLESVNLLVNLMKQPKGEDPSKYFALQTVAGEVLGEMDDDQFVRFFSRTESDKRVVSFKNDILMDMKVDMKKNQYKIKKLLEVNDALPKDSKFLTPHWQLHLSRLVDKYDSFGDAV